MNTPTGGTCRTAPDGHLDHRTEGKNKVYALKPTLKAKSYQQIAEHHKLITLLEKPPGGE